MSLAVLDDYFSFMSDKYGGKPVSPDQLVLIQPAKAMGRPDATSRKHESQIEVTESALSDTGIQRIFKRPNAG
jgi:hypothetical protein